MKPKKLANNLYKLIMYISLSGCYFIYLTGLCYFLDTKNKAGSYFSFLGEIMIFLFASLFMSIFFGRYILDFFELVNNSYTSIILHDKTFGPLFALYSLDPKNIVLGDNTTESKSKKLYLYNLEKKEAIEFEVRLIEPDKEEPIVNGADMPSRKKKTYLRVF